MPEAPLDSERPVTAATAAALRAAKLDVADAGVKAVLLKLAGAIDDIDAYGLNPAGKLDNVSIPTYLKYAESLGLSPAGRLKLAGAKPAAPSAAVPEPKTTKDELDARRAARSANAAGATRSTVRAQRR